MNASPALPPPRLDPALAHAVHRPVHGRHYSRLAGFVLLYALSAWGAWRMAVLAGDHAAFWLAAGPLYLCAAASLHGISLFTHEAVHGTLSRNRVWNAVLGAACALPVLQNYSAYAVLHLRHHAHLGGDADPDHYAGYTRWTWLVFIMNWLRLLIGYPIYIVAIPVLGFRHGTLRDRLGILLELAVLATVAGGLLHLPVSRAFVIHGWLIPMMIINFLVNVRGMSQHTLLSEPDHAVRGTRSILTGPLATFFMCNENYHLEHHLYPGVPWYHLPRVHDALRPELIARGAPFIQSYTAFVREFVADSFRRSPLGRGASGGRL